MIDSALSLTHRQPFIEVHISLVAAVAIVAAAATIIVAVAIVVAAIVVAAIVAAVDDPSCS